MQDFPQRLKAKADVLAAADLLASQDADLARALEVCGAPQIYLSPGGFPGLFRIIVGQQTSTQAAAGIWKRLRAELGERPKPETIITLPEGRLGELGLTRAKSRYVTGIAHAIVTGDLNLRKLHYMTDDEAMAALTALPGIGRWTAEIYLMFHMGRPDLLPANDIALQEAVKILFDLEARPNMDELDEIALRWQPLRGVAARILWAYYRAQRSAKFSAV